MNREREEDLEALNFYYALHAPRGSGVEHYTITPHTAWKEYLVNESFRLGRPHRLMARFRRVPGTTHYSDQTSRFAFQLHYGRRWAGEKKRAKALRRLLRQAAPVLAEARRLLAVDLWCDDE